MTASGVSVVVVEDDDDVAESLEALLESYGYIAFRFASAEAFLAAPEPAADCLLIDMRLPGLTGLELLETLRTRGSTTPVIFVTGHGDIDLAVRSLRTGARDFIEKPYDDVDLIARIEAAMREASDADPERVIHLRRFEGLTPREREVMIAVVAGHPNKVVAHRLGLSPKTVEVHRARVMEKTGAANLSHLVRLALKAGFDPEAAGGPE